VEEVGLLTHQIPEHSVEFTRQSSATQPGVDLPDKVMRAVPISGGVVSFTVDYEKDGIGSQPPPPSTAGSNATGPPFVVEAQYGEVQVLRELMQTSIPKLVGWDIMTEINVQNTIDDARSNTHGNKSDGEQENDGSYDVPF
jgi:hypothetical protein